MAREPSSGYAYESSLATKQDAETTPVVFRKERSGQFKGDVTAVFPTLPSDDYGYKMTCYAHIGQHSGCDWQWYYKTCAARPKEYAELLKEMQGIGYNLRVYSRITGAMRDECKRNARLSGESGLTSPHIQSTDMDAH